MGDSLAHCGLCATLTVLTIKAANSAKNKCRKPFIMLNSLLIKLQLLLLSCTYMAQKR